MQVEHSRQNVTAGRSWWTWHTNRLCCGRSSCEFEVESGGSSCTGEIELLSDEDGKLPAFPAAEVERCDFLHFGESVELVSQSACFFFRKLYRRPSDFPLEPSDFVRAEGFERVES